MVRGDSQLIVNFMLRKYKPGAEFSAGVRAMRDTCGKWRKERRVQVYWEHVKRDD